MLDSREITAQEQTEFDSVRADFERNERDASAYTNDFLAYYKDNFPSDYEQLTALLAEQVSSDELETAMIDLDSTLGQYEYENADWSTYEVPVTGTEGELIIKIDETKGRIAELKQVYASQDDSEKLDAINSKERELLAAVKRYNEAVAEQATKDIGIEADEIALICMEVLDSWNQDFVKPVGAPSPETPASGVVATAPPATPEPAPREQEAPQGPRNEAEFLSSMRSDGWKRLANLEESEDNGKVTVNIPNDRSSPDYIYSRIHQFLGKDEAVKEMKDPENYEVTVNGQRVEWKATDQYKDGTWVAVDGPRAGKRVLVDVGTTTIEWKKKVAQVAEVEPPLPVELPPVAEVEPPVAFLSYDELRPMVVQLKNDATYLKGLPAKRADLVAKKENPLTLRKRYYSQEIAKVDADIATFTGQVEDLTKILNDQVANPAYALALEDGLNPYTDAALALLSLPKPTASASAIADARAVLTNPPPAPVESAPEVMAGENSASGNVG